MSEQKLRSVIIGAGGFGVHALAALCGSSKVDLAGLADKDPAIANSAAAEANCRPFNDNRRLFAETQPAAVFLTVPPAAAGEIIALAAGRKLHIWREVPLGRNLHEAIALCQLAGEAGVKFAVGLQRRFMGGYRHAFELLPRLGKVFMVQAHYLYNWGPTLSWHGDKASGGGAMIELGCHMFDLVTWMLGLPVAVYASAANGQRAPVSPGQPGQGIYDSDDTATAILHYPGKVMAIVIVSRCFNPVSEGLTIYGEAGSISAGPNRCTFCDRDGTVVEGFQLDEPLSAVFGRMIDTFVEAALSKSAVYPCSGWESLLTMATIEAAYLSDQVGQQESPREMLRQNGITPEECLKHAPMGQVQPG